MSRTQSLALLIAAVLAASGASSSAEPPGGTAPTPPDGATAPSVKEKRRELQEIRRELDEKRQSLQHVRQRERGVLRDLRRIEEHHESLVAERDRLAQQLRRLKNRRQATSVRLMGTERVLAAHRTKLAARLHDIQRFARIGYIDVLLGADDFADFLTRFHFLGRIVAADAALIAETDRQQRRWKSLTADLASQTEQVQAVSADVADREREIRREELAKRALFQRVKRERIAFEHVVEDLEEESRQLEALIQKLSGTARVAEPRVGLRIRQGMFWPARGRLTSAFGFRRHPIFGVRRMHTGVDIGSPRGEPVHTAAAGTVLYTGWFGGYGKIVIVDHGAGVSTLYAHLSAILATAGASVERGAIVGRVGSTGYSTAPHLHFEIRVNGTPVNPLGK